MISVQRNIVGLNINRKKCRLLQSGYGVFNIELILGLWRRLPISLTESVRVVRDQNQTLSSLRHRIIECIKDMRRNIKARSFKPLHLTVKYVLVLSGSKLLDILHNYEIKGTPMAVQTKCNRDKLANQLLARIIIPFPSVGA